MIKIRVKAKPNSNIDKVEQITEGQFIISVKEPPVQGRANVAIISILKDYFKTQHVKIISGWTSRNKIIEIGL